MRQAVNFLLFLPAEYAIIAMLLSKKTRQKKDRPDKPYEEEDL